MDGWLTRWEEEYHMPPSDLRIQESKEMPLEIFDSKPWAGEFRWMGGWMDDILRRKLAFARKKTIAKSRRMQIKCCNGRQGKSKHCFWMLARCANPRGNLTASNRTKLFVGRRAASFGISEQIVEISINWFALIPLLWGNLEERTVFQLYSFSKSINILYRKFWRVERNSTLRILARMDAMIQPAYPQDKVKSW